MRLARASDPPRGLCRSAFSGWPHDAQIKDCVEKLVHSTAARNIRIEVAGSRIVYCVIER